MNQMFTYNVRACIVCFTNRKYICGKQSESRVEREREIYMRKLDCILINESEDT
jgi:hypothetical protein